MRSASLTSRSLARTARAARTLVQGTTLGLLLTLAAPAIATPPAALRPVPVSLADAFQRGAAWSVGVYMFAPGEDEPRVGAGFFIAKGIREDEDAVRSLGKNVYLYKMQALVLGGLFGAIAGCTQPSSSGTHCSQKPMPASAMMAISASFTPRAITALS